MAMTEKTPPERRWDWVIVLLALLVLPGVAGARAFGGYWEWAFIAAAALSVFTALVYAADKGRAKQGDWRIGEGTLHLLSLLGGWPGAYAAQHLFRHKTAKVSFQAVFWATVLLHQALALDYLLGWRIARAGLTALGL
ncbi:MAG: DUF1294 domain-containing protein [Candidatus Didemnitutus sp.]|nr:DUF1294 domain-containing protein [Candidatus Didemnitutus sp.]